MKGLTTMIENLTRRQEEIQSQIAELEAQLRQSDSNKNDIARDIQELQNKLFDVREKLSEKVAKLHEAEDELESLRDEYDSQTDLLNDIINYDKQIAGYFHQHVSIMLKAAILDQVLHDATLICRKLPEAAEMAENTFIDDYNFQRWKDVFTTGLRVFMNGIDGATSVAQTSGGGGTSSDMPWRDRDEDFLHFAHRVMLYAHAKCYPGNRHKRTQNR